MNIKDTLQKIILGKKTVFSTPTILQMEAVECGAASLSMIFAYHKLYVPLEKLRIECGISRDGSKASNLIKAAKKYGFEARGFRKDVTKLQRVKLPAIIFWESYHFVVLEGYDSKWFYINDPASGKKKVTYKEFNILYSGIILTFEPTEKFEKKGEKPSIFPGIKWRLKGAKSSILFLILLGLFLIIPGIVIPAFTKIFIDDLLIQNKTDWLFPLITAMAATAFLVMLLSFLQKYFLLRLETNLAVKLSANFFNHIVKMPMAFFSQRFAGDISMRIPLNNSVAQLMSRDIATAFLSIVTATFYLFVLFVYDFALTLIGLSVAVINIAALKFIASKRINLNKKMMQDQGKLAGISMMGLTMIESLKSSAVESDFFSTVTGLHAKVNDAFQRLNIFTNILSTIPSLLTSLNTALILGIGALRVMNGDLTMGSLVAFSVLMGAFLKPVNDLVNLGSKIQDFEGQLERIDDVLNYPKEIMFQNVQEDSKKSNLELTKLTGAVEIKNLTFGYNPLEKPLIEDFNLSLNPGSRVAIIGKSGSGKSTIAKLLSGLYNPWSGDILFDGRLRNEIPRYLLTTSLAMVDQDIFLFEGTATENITMWDNSILFENVISASKDANIHDDIAARPSGYDGLIEEGGRNFSGGQRQRIEIARALVDNPTILLLDEATSALDPTTEKIIDDNLRRRGCTCLIIAHRLSTIRDCDEIIVMDKGIIVQRGTHDILKNQDGIYAELIKE